MNCQKVARLTTEALTSLRHGPLHDEYGRGRVVPEQSPRVHPVLRSIVITKAIVPFLATTTRRIRAVFPITFL